MPKNKMNDLVNILFEQIETLNDPELQGQSLQEQVVKANAIKNLSETILESASISLKAAEMTNEYGSGAIVPEIMRIEHKG